MADDTAVVTDDTTTDTATDDKSAATSTTVLTDKTADTSATTGVVADDKAPDTAWREEWAGDDEGLQKFLGRYHSKPAAIKAMKDLNDGIRTGKYVKPLGDDPSESELADYRKNFGVPDKPEGYTAKLPDGLVVGDDDKPYVDEFAKAMLEANAPKGSFDAGLKAYYAIVEKQSADATERERAAKTEAEDTLREEWGGDYRRNLNVVNSFLETAPEQVKNALTGGFGPDGIMLANNAEMVKWLAGLALEKNPIAAVVPGAGSNQAQAISDEIANIEKLMGNKGSDYWTGPKSAAMQKRYLQLVEANEKLKGQ